MTLMNARDLDTSAVRYVVDQMFYETGGGFVHGPSGAGKSYAFLTKLALDVANGAPFFGHKTVRGNVVVALGEGVSDAGIRTKAQLAQHAEEVADRYAEILASEGQDAADEFAAAQLPYTDEGVIVEDAPFSIPFEKGKPSVSLQRFIASVEGAEPALVIYDAMADFCGDAPSITNDSTANRFSMGVKYMVDQLNCFVLGIGHDTEKGDKMLGAGRFKNAADVMIGVKPGNGDGEVSGVVSEKAKASTKFRSFSYTAVPKEWDEPVMDDFGFPTGKTERVHTHVVKLLDDSDEGTGFVLPSAARELPAGMLPAMRTVQPKTIRKRTGVRIATGLSVEERAARVGELLSQPCHECGAAATGSCNPLPGSLFSTIAPGIQLHVSRAAQQKTEVPA